MDDNQQPNQSTVSKKSFVLIIFGIFGLTSIITGLIVIGGVYLVITKLVPRENQPAVVATPSYREDLDTILASNPPALGSSTAPVTVIEFADFQCPYCKEFHDQYLPQLKSSFIDTGKVRFVFQHYPFLGPESNLAAEAAVCAEKQGSFWPYHDGLYKKQTGENIGNFTQASLIQIAQDIKIPLESFTACLTNHEGVPSVEAQLLRANGMTVRATPTLFINDQKYEGVKSYAHLEALINQALEAKK